MAKILKRQAELYLGIAKVVRITEPVAAREHIPGDAIDWCMASIEKAIKEKHLEPFVDWKALEVTKEEVAPFTWKITAKLPVNKK